MSFAKVSLETTRRILEGDEDAGDGEDEELATAEDRLFDIKTSMLVIIGTVGALAIIAIMCYCCSLRYDECCREDPYSDDEMDEEEKYESTDEEEVDLN